MPAFHVLFTRPAGGPAEGAVFFQKFLLLNLIHSVHTPFGRRDLDDQ